METKPKSPLLRRLTTPLITVTFLVVAVSGILMLFHIQDAVLRGPHEIFCILFVIASVTHVILNWKALVAHLRKRAFWICSAVTIAVAAVVLAGAMHHAEGEVGPQEVVRVIEAARIDRLAPLVGTTPDELVIRLQRAGMNVTGPTVTLRAVSEASQRPIQEVVAVALRSSD
jgi:hypothetical protein